MKIIITAIIISIITLSIYIPANAGAIVRQYHCLRAWEYEHKVEGAEDGMEAHEELNRSIPGLNLDFTKADTYLEDLKGKAKAHRRKCNAETERLIAEAERLEAEAERLEAESRRLKSQAEAYRREAEGE